MTSYRSDFLHQAHIRGFIHQGTALDTLDHRLCQGPIVAYTGFDASGPSLHIGSLIQLMLMRWLQETGNQVFVLLGGSTTKIGDPSGKDITRPLLSPQTIQENMASLETIFKTFLGTPKHKILNNSEWLETLGYVEFLDSIGRYVSVNRLLTLESVRLRLERQNPLTFLEFNYSLLQAYDFLKLFETHSCHLQCGGSDQWGNIVSGVDLIRRLKGAQAFGLTTPLILTASGHKMGKTAQGAVWLNADASTPYDYWQFWRNTQDNDVGRFLRLFTMLPLQEIEKLEALQGVEMNEAKIQLADQATQLLHGYEVLNPIHATSQALFKGQEILNNHQGLPLLIVLPQELSKGLMLSTGLEKIGLVSSKSEARKLIRAGAVRLQNEIITDELRQLKRDDFSNQPTIKISVGKKKHAIIQLKLEP